MLFSLKINFTIKSVVTYIFPQKTNTPYRSLFRKGVRLVRITSMKKRLFTVIALTLTAVVATATVISAVPKLSPALDVISSETVMVKSSLAGTAVTFSEEDFEMVLGTIPSQIKISTLPSETDGVLKLGNTDVFEGQTISKGNLGLLYFEPKGDNRLASFEFTCPNSYSIKCVIKGMDRKNSAPCIANGGAVSTVTQTDITCFGSLYGYDEDGDKLYFEAVDYPTKGLLTITDHSVGSFTYTPYEGVVGADSFTYRVKDEFGAYSEKCTVNLKISERATDAVLSDMDGHWAYNAALSAIADGSMDVIAENGKLYFDPDESLTREEFLKAVMKAIGAGELPDVTTVFADDSSISDGHKGYAAAAYKLGIIKGETVNGQVYFRPTDVISRAEAAVILNRILGAEGERALTVFSDFDKIPAWAEADMKALSTIGIISGNANYIDPMRPVTRAETAQMIYAAKNIYM